MKLITPSREISYLAIPYSHPNPEVRERRFRAANILAGILIRQGKFVYSPISQTHPISAECDLPTNWPFWKALDTAFLGACKELIVATVDGWRKSNGVTEERLIAINQNVPIRYWAKKDMPREVVRMTSLAGVDLPHLWER